MRYTNTMIMAKFQLFQKKDAGGGPEAGLLLGVALANINHGYIPSSNLLFLKMP